MAKANVPAKAGNSLPTVNDDLAKELLTGPTGFEDVTADDLIIPRLTVLQSNSPQLNKTKAEFDPDARPGNIYDVGMQEDFGDEGILFLPVHWAKQFIEWHPRESGKGLAAIHDDPAVLDRMTEVDSEGRACTKEGTRIVTTYQFYGFNLSANKRRCFIPMASTQIKKAKRILTLATSEKIMVGDQEVTPPIFYRSYRLAVVPESNNKGDWFGWDIHRDKSLDEMDRWQVLMQEVKEFRDAITSGTVKADIESMAEEVSGETIDEDGAM